MSDVMSVRLHLSGVRVRRVLVDAVDRLEVEVESVRGVDDHRNSPLLISELPHLVTVNT